LHEGNSDLEQDPTAGDADVEDDEAPVMSGENGSRKKSKKKKKRAPKEREEQDTGDSDGQGGSEEEGLVEDLTEDALAAGEGISLRNPQMSLGKLEQLQKAMELLKMPTGAPKSIEEAKRKQYQFWDTQPVPKIDEEINVNEPIETDKPQGEIRQDPYSLPAGFHWDTLDIQDPLILKELYTLLNENYVEDDDNMFRFDYSPDFLKWALQPPGWLKEWHCGVRVKKSGKMIGFISAVPAHIKVYEKTQKMVEINFLCVHKKLRSKRVAPVLIREITRRVNCMGIFQAVYTAGVVLPKPVATCRYWHRSLNPRKLIEVKFSHLSRNMTMQRTLKLYKLPDQPKTPGFRTFTPADLDDAYKLVAENLNQFELGPMFTKDEFRHWFLPRPGIVDGFVVETDGKLTDFVSFYTLPSTVMHHPQHKTLKAAYSFYNVSTRTNWTELMQDGLIVAKNMGFDVFNALDLMENKQFLEKLKFGVGDGSLQYYLYNWRCPTMSPDKVGLVLQ